MYYKRLDTPIDDLIFDRIKMMPRGQITNRQQLEDFTSKLLSEKMPLDQP